MEGFGLLCGHLLGDYILQNDWMAKNKTNPSQVAGTLNDAAVWDGTRREWWIGHLACFIHCFLYTLAVWACSFWWMPWWGLVACFAVHFPIDRWRLVRRWMENVSGQKDFASGVFAPWSIIVVDNTFHLLTLFAIGGTHALMGTA